MKDTITRQLGRLQSSFTAFTTGQKVVAVIGTMALLLAGFMVYRWASAPSYAPLFSNLAAEDAATVVEHLETEGVPYQLADDGTTVMVPREAVYKTRIDLSAEGLGASDTGGYSLLDDQGLSTSKFQEQTSFKRAMEGELAATVEGIDDVETAVVHLALPEKQVFADEQDPPTASVLVKTRPGTTLTADQVQAVVNLVAASIDGMETKNVTVADSTGTVLTAPDGSGAAAATAQSRQQDAVQQARQAKLQAMLDTVVGPGNSTVQVTTALDFDKTRTRTTDYVLEQGVPPLSRTEATETYNGPAGAGVGGVVGPDGQMDGALGGTAAGASSYEKRQVTEDNAVGSIVEERETAPGSLKTQHVSVVLDADTTGDVNPADIRAAVTAAVGIDPARGDTIQVSSIPFDRSAEAAATAELEAAAKAEAGAARMELIRKGALALGVLLVLLLAWFRARRRAKARTEATTLVVEQLRADQARTALEASPAALALEEAEKKEDTDMQQELNALIERQPEDVAALLRGWLTERV